MAPIIHSRPITVAPITPQRTAGMAFPLAAFARAAVYRSAACHGG
jgi:hypothetical protein